MNIIRIKTGYGAKNLTSIESSPNTQLTLYFNEIEIPIMTDSKGVYTFEKPLPLVCLVYENISISSENSSPIIPIYGDLDLSTECDTIFSSMLMLNALTNQMHSISFKVERGRILFDNIKSRMSYIGIV